MMREYKLLVLGSEGVGKTALARRFAANCFLENYSPALEDSYRKQVRIGDQSCLLDILDNGQEEFSATRDHYIRVSQGFVCVYDITSRASFDEVTVFYHQIRRVMDVDHPAVVVVGNKCDLESQRQVAVAEGAALAQSFGGGCVFLETSAKEDMNVQECFLAAVRLSSVNKNIDSNSQRCSLS